MSTTISSRSSAVISKSQDKTYDVPQHQITWSGNSSSAYNPPVKLDFPCFGDEQDEDPIVFIEHCEEYFAVCPLNDSMQLAALTSVLKRTAKDWWQAEKINVHGWRQFKELFLCSTFSEDYDMTARKLLERKQGVRESIRDFAFPCRVLCLRWKREMSEKDIVQAILRNCNS